MPISRYNPYYFVRHKILSRNSAPDSSDSITSQEPWFIEAIDSSSLAKNSFSFSVAVVAII